MKNDNIQNVKLVARKRNKYATTVRSAISGRNAAYDTGDMALYRLFDEAFERAYEGWQTAQQAEMEVQ